MERYLSIYFPYIQGDYLAIKKPELKGRSFVFTVVQHGRVKISATTKAAEEKGIVPGMALADAKVINPDLLAFDDEAHSALKLIKHLAKWAIRYSPNVALDAPDGIIINSSGCAHLFGGEEKYVQNIASKLQEIGYHCQLALSDTIGTSWGLSRHAKTTQIIPSHEQHLALSQLPPQALRLTANLVDKLYKLGFQKIGSFMQLPDAMLRRRFGNELLLRLHQALGREKEPLIPIIVKPAFEERLYCLEPIKTKSGIEIAIEKLLQNLCKRLAKEGMGIRSAELKGYRIDGILTAVKIGTNQATHQINHLCKLFELKISEIEPALGIEIFCLTATKTEPIVLQQEKLWSGKNSINNQNLAQLLDRLAGKVGEQAIKRYLPQAHYWPERSLRKALSLEEKSTVNWQGIPRPMEILHQPVAIQVSAPIPDYPPMNFRYKGELHLIRKADGPERIEREWWLDTGAHRDYYILEDEKGRRYWVFRSGHYNEAQSAWFLHGFFA